MTMKRIIFFLLIVNILFPLAARETDNEGMPIIYLRGSFGNNPWEPNKNYRFIRDGLNYRLKINSDNPLPSGCEFKIGDTDWNFDFGAKEKNMFINQSSVVTFKAKGENFKTNGIYNGEISFVYTEDSLLDVTFDITSTVPELKDLLSGDLPVLYINVYTDESHKNLDNEIISMDLSHKDYFTYAEYWLECDNLTNSYGENFVSIGNKDNPLPLQIKARGNWTRIGFSKKPFKIKLDKKQDLLGLTLEKSKHYALLAHADDNKGYLRNYISFNLGKRIGLPWVPSQYPIELVVNGDYRGLYFLTESIRIQEGRIEISELEDNETDSELISGGYLVELDNYDEPNQIRMEEKSSVNNQYLDALRITWDIPEDYSEIQRRFVKDQFTTMNNMIGTNNDDIWSYIDLDDLARYYLVNEIISHTEAFHGSTYLYRDRGENQKWHFSPLWDAGNAFSGYTDSYFYDCDPYGNTWIPSFRNNNRFNQKVKETWLWFMSNEFEGIYDDIDDYVSLISKAAKCDYNRWNNQPVPAGGQAVADNSDMIYRKSEVKRHIESKISWLKTKFGNYSTQVCEEPAKDETPAAPLPDYAHAFVEQIDLNFISPDTEFYNLQGIRIYYPAKGQIYIKIQNGKATKVIFN